MVENPLLHLLFISYHIISEMAKGRNRDLKFFSPHPIQKIHGKVLPCASAECNGRWRVQQIYNVCPSRIGQPLIFGPPSISSYY